ncbi:MAG TPA: DUF3617 family protein [Caulobacteraceae bacterium]|nr:DUF3617 family protein [Caulobacteraceae bacterium]
MKPGLWRQSYSFDGAPTATRVLCSSGGSLAPPRLGGVCSKYELRRTAAGGLIADAVCTQDGLTATMHSEDTGDFSRHFTEDNSITNGFPGQPPQTSRGHLDTEYLGPCPSGAKPAQPAG